MDAASIYDRARELLGDDEFCKNHDVPYEHLDDTLELLEHALLHSRRKKLSERLFYALDHNNSPLTADALRTLRIARLVVTKVILAQQSERFHTSPLAPGCEISHNEA